eukprot:985478-Pyramimonas_sp.AAC.1
MATSLRPWTGGTSRGTTAALPTGVQRPRLGETAGRCAPPELRRTAGRRWRPRATNPTRGRAR